jgi:7-carboxy-7-deazaguanine synthase
MNLFVSEIFHSIQGESIYAGRPCTFIRLSGCNLRCTYCDTVYAYDQDMAMSLQEIVQHVENYRCPLVEITGGEPLFQNHTPLLIVKLLEKGYEVMMETNGTYDISHVDARCIKIVDIKCPGSGEEIHNRLENLRILTPRDQIKFVIGNREDYQFSKAIIHRVDSKFPPDHILLSPVFGKMNPAELAEWILQDHLKVRLHLQLHKMIWPNKKRGV